MTEKLGEYAQKRNFAETKEPAGKQTRKSKNGKLIFAVQLHAARRLHYDLRLEWDGVLLSWAVPKGPSFNPRDKRLAVKVEDHPVDYADYEGVIPKGQYGGGTVMLWDKGLWEPLNDVDKGLQDGSLKFSLKGKRLKGKWTLVKLKDGEQDNWLLIKEKDGFVKDFDGISSYVTGISSGRTMEKITAEESPQNKVNPFNTVQAELAELANDIPSEKGWLYEIKYDGYRITAFTEKGETRLVTRNNLDYTAKFPSIAKAVTQAARGRAAVLDGELIAAGTDGRSDFQALQHYSARSQKQLIYMAFDLLALDGDDLRDMPLYDRKAKLRAFLAEAPSEVRYSAHVEDRGGDVYAAAQAMGLEGVVGKKADSAYRKGKNGDWIKLKCYKRQEFVIGGYTESDKKQHGIGALLLGFYEGNKLIYVGRAGTGISTSEAKRLLGLFRPLAAEHTPFANAPPRKGEHVKWLKPELTAEIQYGEMTEEKVLRQASYKGLRYDKPPRDVIMEVGAAKQRKTETAESGRAGKNKTEVAGVAVSSPDRKVFFNPEVSKIDVARYYEAAAERMMPYAGGRVLSVVRCHKGVKAGCFFKKHPQGKAEGVEVVTVANSEGEEGEYFYLSDGRGLISEIQLGTVEFHVWGSRVENMEKPDMMVFDLDPDEGMDLTRIQRGVKDLKSVLDKLNLKSFLKTSGGKGYHVVVPFIPSASWQTFHDFARKVAELMENKWPDRYTSNVRKIKRKGRIFIDWARNGRGSTSVAPYSLRARPGAKVSMPIAWTELDTVAPDGVDIFDAVKRLGKRDPWKNFFAVEQTLDD